MDGFVGCYRGIVPKLCGNVASVIACHKVLETLELGDDENEGENEENAGRRVGLEISDEYACFRTLIFSILTIYFLLGKGRKQNISRA